MEFVTECFLAGMAFALLCWYYFKWLPKVQLRERFGKLGNMALLRKEDIEKKIGRPKASYYYDDYSRHTWQAGDYAVTLQFDERNIFERLVSEVDV